MKHVVMTSGGLSSWVAARRVKAQHGTDNLVLLFADTLIEDADLYRFLDDMARDIGVPITRIADGRTPWQVFKDKRFLGNSRIDPCSLVLKRDLMQKWMDDNCDPTDTVAYIGIGWWEEHRYTNPDFDPAEYARLGKAAKEKPGLKERKALAGWRYEAPLCDRPYITQPMMEEMARAAGIEIPRLYKLGFKHNNCGGGCVKAGIGQFAHLHKMLPDVFDEWERNENELRELLGDVAILTDRRNKQRRPMPLSKLRARLEGREEALDVGEINDTRGCGCAVDSDEDANPND